MGGFDDGYGFEGFVLLETSPGKTVLSPLLPSKGSVRGQKRVSSRAPGGEKEVIDKCWLVETHRLQECIVLV